MNFLQELQILHPGSKLLVIESKNHTSTIQKLYINREIVSTECNKDVVKTYLCTILKQKIAEKKFCKPEDVTISYDPFACHSVMIFDKDVYC